MSYSIHEAFFCSMRARRQKPETGNREPANPLPVLFLILFLLAASPGCGDAPPPPSSRETGKIVVAVDATLIPMAFVNDQNELAGFEVDLIRELARKAGLEIQLVNVEWAGLFGGLITRKFDAVISSVTILEERKKRMAFSIPYLRSGVAMVVRTETQGIETLEHVKANRLLVGAQVGTTAYFLIERDPQIRKRGYQQYGHAIADLVNPTFPI